MADDLATLRAAIDAADADLVAALGRRLAAVRAVGDLKRAQGLSAVDAAREASLHARWSSLAAEAGVPSHLAASVLAALLDGTRDEVRRRVEG